MLIAVAPRVALACYRSGPVRVFPELIAFCGEAIDEILDGELSMPGSHRRYLQGFVSRDSRARPVPGLNNIPIAIDRNRL